MRLAQAHVALRPGAPEPEPGGGIEVTRAATVRRFRVAGDASEAVQAVQAAVDDYMTRAGDRARLLSPPALVPLKR
jgi:hypothetical protein